MNPRRITMSIIAFCFCLNSLIAQNRIYVDMDATGAGDGSSWSDAYNDPQDAIDAAIAGDSIWVAEGVYMPSRDISGNPNPSDPRAKSFYIDVDLKIFGGFDGTEAALVERDVKNNLSILSGDIGTVATYGDNSYHVLIISGNPVNPISPVCEIDGLVIENGNANVTSLTSIEAGGGGILVRGGGGGSVSSPTIANCTFRYNYGYAGGGALRADGTSNGTSEPRLLNCTFHDNNSDRQGSAIDVNGNFGTGGNSNADVINCLFYNNQSSQGSVFSLSASGGPASATITNSTFVDNPGVVFGGGSNPTGTASLSFNNSLAFGNGTFSTMFGTTYNQTTSLINVDPLFVDRASRNFRLQPCSPALDAGTDGLNNVNTDIEGNLRIQGGGIDIGAYETWIQAGPPNTIHVSSVTNGCQDGLSWASAYNDLQEALDNVAENGVIWIAQGVYSPSVDTLGLSPADSREKTFFINKNIKVYGGFNGTETLISERVISQHETILSGVINNTGTQADSAYHVVLIRGGSGGDKITTNCELDGLTISGGLANSTVESNRQDRGAGLYLDGEGTGNECSPTIRNCKITGNHSYLGGGGLLVTGGSGGLSNPIIYNSYFNDNFSNITGSAIWVDGRLGEAKATIYNTQFFKNTGDNDVFRGAAAVRPDGGIADLHLINCTFASNSPAAILSYAFPGSLHELRLENNIFWDNGVDITDLADDGVTYIDANNLMGIDPQFVDLSTGNLELMECSRAVNFGNNALNNTNFDLLGNARVQSTIIDAGAFESPYTPIDYSTEIIYVDQQAIGCNTGASWEDAFQTIQEAINVAVDKSEIRIAQGTYREGSELLIEKPLAIKGGYPTGGGIQNVEINITNILGSSLSSATGIHRVIRAIHTSDTLILEGLSIGDGGQVELGAGIYNEGGAMLLKSCKVGYNFLLIDSDQSNYSRGAGIYNLSGNIHLENCEVFNNEIFSNQVNMYVSGGGIYNEFGDIYMDNCRVYDNSVMSPDSSFGGGIYNANGNVHLVDCALYFNKCRSTSNTSTSKGGCIYNENGNIHLSNSIVARNEVESESNSSGGGVYQESGETNLINSKVADNISTGGSLSSFGGGIYNNTGSTLSLVNCGVTDNYVQSGEGAGIYGDVILANSFLYNNLASPTNGVGRRSDHEGGLLIASYSLIERRNLPGIGNIEAAFDFEPFFVDEPNRDYRLQNCSPLRDAGLDSFNATSTDLDENNRFAGTIDIGPHEYQCLLNPVVSVLSDTGIGSFRWALVEACGDATIHFDPAINGQEIQLTNDDINICRNVNVQGNGLSNTILELINSQLIISNGAEARINDLEIRD